MEQSTLRMHIKMLCCSSIKTCKANNTSLVKGLMESCTLKVINLENYQLWTNLQVKRIIRVNNLEGHFQPNDISTINYWVILKCSSKILILEKKKIYKLNARKKIRLITLQTKNVGFQCNIHLKQQISSIEMIFNSYWEQ